MEMRKEIIPYRKMYACVKLYLRDKSILQRSLTSKMNVRQFRQRHVIYLILIEYHERKV
jgi:hypothetical protein